MKRDGMREPSSLCEALHKFIARIDAECWLKLDDFMWLILCEKKFNPESRFTPSLSYLAPKLTAFLFFYSTVEGFTKFETYGI